MRILVSRQHGLEKPQKNEHHSTGNEQWAHRRHLREHKREDEKRSELENDPDKKRRVGVLVGGIVYLQLTALLVLTLMFPQVAVMRPLLIAGAVMLILLRLFKTVLPKVSAS